MLGLASGAILVPLNSTMLAVALPSVMKDFGVGAATVASLVTLYLGAVAITLPVSGSLGDRFGHRRVFLFGVAGFALASALAATAGSFEVLAASRVIQAATGGLVSTSSVALLRAMAPEDRRGSAFGLFDMLVSTSAAIGPLVGGLLVAGLGWRSLFVVAVPVALLAAVAVGAVAPPQETGPARAVPRPIDVPGLGLLAAFLISLLLGLRGLEGGGPESLAIIAAPVLLVLFVLTELRTEQPAVDPRLFASRAFAAAVVGIFGTTVILHATLVLVPLLVERLQGGNAQTSGVVLLGISALGALAAPIGGRYSDAVGRRRPAVLGTLAIAAGLGALWIVAPEASTLLLGVLLAVVGFGMGMSGSPRQTAALEMIEPERVGMAAGTYLTGRYVGGALGATLAGAVLGGTVTAAGVSTGFGLLAAVAVGVAAASLFLPGRRESMSRGAA
ncbi:MAG TPA: MFS transporter [Methylomirabilota bacterium]|nr:MFS transporter [Methylomirabilota bacterium]